MQLFIKFYNSLLDLSEPLLKAHLNRRIKRGKEDAARINERFGISNIARGEKPVFWFHAASVGESLSLLPVFERMQKDYPDVQLMITTGTVTSAEMMAKRLPEGIIHQYFPLDNPKWVCNFLDHWKPNVAFWTDSEFWPAMFNEIKNRKIPLILLNTRISKDSFKKWLLVKPIIKEIMSAFTICLGPSNEVEKAKILGAKAVKATDNMKYCTKAQPYKEAMLKELQEYIGDRKVILWSSTHEGEEEIALYVHKNLAEEFKDLLTIILPRHTTRKDELKKLMDSSGLSHKFRSDLKLPSKEDAVYIADTMGETGLFYKFSGICVMGGTFCDVGGHNLIEPAHYACKIFYGPQIFNFLTIHEDFASRNAAVQVQTKEEMVAILQKFLRAPGDFSKMGLEAQKLAQEKAMIIDNILNEISPFIKEAIK